MGGVLPALVAARALPCPRPLGGPSSRSSPSADPCGHAGVATEGSMEEWGRRFCHATLSERALPLPPLRRPPLSRARSSRLRSRAKSRREAWKHFEGLRRTLNSLYSDYLPSSTAPGGPRPIQMSEFDGPSELRCGTCSLMSKFSQECAGSSLRLASHLFFKC